jgi:hypothetical protein
VTRAPGTIVRETTRARGATAAVDLPACMGIDEFARWCAANRALHGVADQVSSPCRDCTAAFADEMQGVGRCNGDPAGDPLRQV